VRDKVLIDTSVWIAYLKGADVPLAERVDEILAHSTVCVPRVVIAELIQGAKTEKEIAVIEEFAEAFTIIDQTAESWQKAGRLSFAMKRKGISVHLVDCYIAVLASENECRIFSLDKHFQGIKKFLKIELLPR
jgi:predicted nucleic acid-binding protein